MAKKYITTNSVNRWGQLESWNVGRVGKLSGASLCNYSGYKATVLILLPCHPEEVRPKDLYSSLALRMTGVMIRWHDNSGRVKVWTLGMRPSNLTRKISQSVTSHWPLTISLYKVILTMCRSNIMTPKRHLMQF